MAIDEEQGRPTTASYGEQDDREFGRAESHQAEQPPLIWSDSRQTWAASEGVEPSQTSTSTSSSSRTTDVANGASADSPATGGQKEGLVGKESQSNGLAQPSRLPSTNEPIYVQFEDDDPENPFDWSPRRKWIITGIGSWLTTLVAIAGPGYVSGLTLLQEELGVSHIVGSLSFSLYPLGFGLGPLVLAPISEVYGRNPMYLGSTVLFTLFYLPLALGNNIALICVFRFLSGVAGSVGSTMVGGTIADIWTAKERGRPMALFSIGAFAGTGIGPAMFGYVAQNAGWRWIEWIQMIMAGLTSALTIAFFRETRGSVILSKRAAKLRRETGLDYRCRADEERASLAILIKTGISRPLWFLVSEPIVLALSVWIGFAWGCLYGLVEAIPLVYENIYGWRIGAVGLAFLSIVLGALLGYAANGFQEKAYQRLHPKKGIEARLYSSMFGGVLFAVGSMIFAWAIHGHWIGPLFGLTILIFGIYFIYQGVFLYLADTYTVYASSAMSAQSFARNLMGFSFPLFITQMYTNLGYSWAAFTLSMISFTLSVIPFVLYRYGDRIRAHSPAAIELARQLAEAEQKKQERLAAKEARRLARLQNGTNTGHAQTKVQ